ncbi:hypothetical protein D0Z70_10615 [Sphingobium terrigena]|uniref:Uncharacterized protein n=1 Tax=Sphingobium terrigena TaxID=2304063 RepID=A0A418YSK6_9SPHN|nr:hypothetical protein [Sphingobium terrigena]RJG54822.1 hypothetical protein D0Z70_10615 [Sphingobium terrigena]
MNLFDALTFTKDYLDDEVRAFKAFFRADGAIVEVDRDDRQIVTSAVLYLVIGVTLQDSYISGLKIDQIGWLDRALGQIVFWVSTALFVQLLANLIGAKRGGAMLVALAVVPMAFLCGAYAASIGYFVSYTARTVAYNFYGSDERFTTLANWFNLATQLFIIGRYMPRELRSRCLQTPRQSCATVAFALLFILFVDLVAMLGSNFLPDDGVKA